MKTLNILWVEGKTIREVHLADFMFPLEDDGHNFTYASTVAEAKEVLKGNNEFDIAIVDLLIARGYESNKTDQLAGFEVIDDLVENRSFSPEKILILTVENGIDAHNKTLSYGIPNDNYMAIGTLLPTKIQEKIYEITKP